MMNLVKIVFHPFESFGAIKDEGKGSPMQAVVIVAAWFAAAMMERQNTGYAFNMNDPDDLNVWLIGAKTALLFGLWVVGNWAVATWLDGEGKAAQIAIVSAYALVPYVASLLLATALSNVFLREEGVFLHYMTTVGTLWSGALLLIGMQIVHDYGFARTVQSLALTVAAMGIIVFLFVLFYTLFQQAWLFVYTIYNELLFRM
ncbi:Yip1 family protein [Paenibacillus sp.]|uniref:Yip1 family protein n=1 Tax=Paenibacillus sp. TaxID=58172 RepID=UPI002D651F1A|nr:Yip1 family protein [Paenibacillus sp.]HZG85818.1 Yip1 family protein [Paenibacillus sp.]